MRDYLDWHDAYEQPGSPLHQRLQVVVELLGAALDTAPPGAVRVVSLCAGQGADVLAVAQHHARGGDLTGLLVELDARNVARARRRIDDLGLDGLEVVEADAGRSDVYASAVPADLVVACGIFGNISERDIERTVRFLPSLCASGARVVWTRHPRQPEVLDRIQGWLEAVGFESERLVVSEEQGYGVGLAHLMAPPAPYRPGEPLFEFIR